MDLVYYLPISLGKVVLKIIQFYMLIVIARALISWVGPDPYNPIVRFLYNATDPVLQRIRRVLPLQFSGVDLSPMALLLILYVLQDLIQFLLVSYG